MGGENQGDDDVKFDANIKTEILTKYFFKKTKRTKINENLIKNKLLLNKCCSRKLKANTIYFA